MLIRSSVLILVARSGLGTLNHTLLTIEALKIRKIPILGIILNGDLHEDNPKTLEDFGNTQILARLPMYSELNANILNKEWKKQQLDQLEKEGQQVIEGLRTQSANPLDPRIQEQVSQVQQQVSAKRSELEEQKRNLLQQQTQVRDLETSPPESWQPPKTKLPHHPRSLTSQIVAGPDLTTGRPIVSNPL